MIKLSLVISLTLFLTGFLPGTAKPEMAVEDTGFERLKSRDFFRWAASQWFPFPFVIQALLR